MITAILLAAGESKRLFGENKLIKIYKKKPLINHILSSLIKSKINKIIVVLGFEHSKVKKKLLKNKKIKLEINKNYKKGMSSSIKLGLKNLNKNSKGFLIVQSDMPFISKKIINKIISKIFSSDKQIILPRFKKKIGNPIGFKQSISKEIFKIKGYKGAKKIIRRNRNKIEYINTNSRSIHIDFDDLKAFKR